MFDFSLKCTGRKGLFQLLSECLALVCEFSNLELFGFVVLSEELDRAGGLSLEEGGCSCFVLELGEVE